MLLYLDTSSLVKLYVEETDSREVADLVSASKVAATSIVAYAEARAAFARRFREKAFRPKDYARLLSAFEEDWKKYAVMVVSKELVRFAGDLAERRKLRGFDAIHLSSAVFLQEETKVPVYFSCFDANLESASHEEGLLQP